MRRLVIGGMAALLLGLVATPVAAAQTAPEYVSSEPEDGATLHEAPERVEVTFNEPLDESSTLKVVDECNRQLDDGTTAVDGNSMSIGIVKKPAGEYHVEYVARSIEGLTGETEGHLMFTVHFGKACDGEDHGEHGSGGDGKGKHEGDHGSGGDDHNMSSDADHGTADHDTGTDHTQHASGGTDHDEDHSAGMGGGHDKHNKKSGDHSKHGKHQNNSATGEVPGISSPDDTRRVLDRADSTALIAALALCALLGILGGAVLRLSARP